MPNEHALTMVAASRRDFHLVLGCVLGLLLLAALFSATPLFLLLVICLMWAVAMRFPGILFATMPTETNVINLASDGELSFESNRHELSAGALSGTQWCTRFLAVLRYRSGSAIRYCVLIAAHQSPDSFRQLCVWVRHNYRKEDKDQS